MSLKVGDWVRVLVDHASCAGVRKGDIGQVIHEYEDGEYDIPGTCEVKMLDGSRWTLSLGEDIELITDGRQLGDTAISLGTLKVRFKKLNPEAVTPTRAHADDAGYDLTTIDDGTDCYPETDPNNVYYYREYGTGLALEIPTGYVGLIFPRSSISKTGLSLANCVGVIDAGYRGEIKFRFKVDAAGSVLQGTKKLKAYNKGDRIGQLIIMPILDVALEEAAELSESARASGGFGSSGS